jgi:hypothetical protein
MYEVRWPEFAKSLEAVGPYLDDRMRIIFVEPGEVLITVRI